MIPFLKSVARAYASRYSDLSDFCFLFPNKRSGTFFMKYLKEERGGRAFLSPRVLSVSDFVSEVSGKVAASRLDLLFLLYHTYRDYLGLGESDDAEGVDFDSFRMWGETVLADFNEVDLYLADADEIFKNVKDYREIASNFLTEEQKEVMAEYFGRTEYSDPNEFWKDFDAPDDELSDLRRKFLHLWRIMAPLYHGLHERLDSLGLSTTGGLYRSALRVVREKGRDILPYRKVTVVGFNALSTAERAIFSELRDMEPYPGEDTFADFFWDATGPVLSGTGNSASKFVRSNIRSFPCPEWALHILRQSDTPDMPSEIKVVASPSNSAQVKIAGTLLSELRGRLTQEEFNDARVAVVLPDENLLLPMLYSLPAGMGDVNLTMGYPLRLTSVVPFVSLLRRLHFNMRETPAGKAFYHKDLRLFLAHPYPHALLGSDVIEKINGYLDRYHKAVISLNELAAISEKAESLLSSLDRIATPLDAIDRLDEILSDVKNSLTCEESGLVKTRLEISHIEIYRDALRRMRELLREYNTDMKAATALRLADRLLAGEKVGFEGEPLVGLQVMGMLETRSIDFDHIFILSANERILPMRARTRSFIPDTLRRAFGMPPSNYAESIFAYYFYRMISRARGVTMIYDARSGGGMRSGDVSRYLLQLRYLFAKDRLVEEDWKFVLTGKTPHEASVDKTPEILERLKAFVHDPAAGNQDRSLNFSASSLNSYRECQVKFFYQSVMGINTDPEPSEFIDSISAGNILHDVMLQLYLPPEKRGKLLPRPVVVTKDAVSRILEDHESLKRIMTRTVNRVHFNLEDDQLDRPLEGGAEIVGRQLARQAVNILRHDVELAPFNILGCEISERLHIALPSGRKVNFRFAIDRLDEIDTQGGRQLRIVDYKTGRIKLKAADMEEVLKGNYAGEQIFQLFTYAWLLGKRGGVEGARDVRLEIYDVNKIHTGEVRLPVIGDNEVKDFGAYADDFSAGMESLLDGIFDTPRFEAADDESDCGMCRLRTLCRR